MDGVPSWLFDWLTRNLSDEQLQALHAHVYDRFTWETGDQQDAHLRDALEVERDARSRRISETLTFKTIQPGNGIVFVDDADSGTITISIDPDYKPDPEVSILESHGQV